MVMYTHMYLFIMFFVSALVIFVLKYKHFLVMLLSLEMLVLSLYTILIVWISLYLWEYFICILYLIISVCEGSLGLSVLVMMIRTHGNDQLMILDNLW